MVLARTGIAPSAVTGKDRSHVDRRDRLSQLENRARTPSIAPSGGRHPPGRAARRRRRSRPPQAGGPGACRRRSRRRTSALAARGGVIPLCKRGVDIRVREFGGIRPTPFPGAARSGPPPRVRAEGPRGAPAGPVRGCVENCNDPDGIGSRQGEGPSDEARHRRPATGPTVSRARRDVRGRVSQGGFT
jgi:hypothetical protein